MININMATRHGAARSKKTLVRGKDTAIKSKDLRHMRKCIYTWEGPRRQWENFAEN